MVRRSDAAPTEPHRASRDPIADPYGPRSGFRGEGEWPVRVDELVDQEPDRWVQSACVLCSNGCGIDVGVKEGRIVGVRGRAVDAVNRGRLGPKGLHGWRANHSADRLRHPLIRRGGELVEATWEEAMGLVVRKSKEIVERFTASAIGFHTSGQLMLEEYYTLGVIGKAGLGTPHMDGNTRLCTATAAAALKESFGSDGQPGAYADLDVADTIVHWGHNIAETDTVLWMRILDRRRGPMPPRLIAVDPRSTATTREADLHLAPKPGTNVALLNGILHLLLQDGHVDRAFVERHTVGFDVLEKVVAGYPPHRVEQITGVPAEKLKEAARMVGEARALMSTVLQGFYQSNQATAASVQVNNVHLVRGMIGKPGCGILQMNGQPTAQNTRETGADGDLPGFRNWDNPEHIRELAELWNVDVAKIPHWAPPTHAMQIFRYCETGSIRMLWISGTNPAVSMPDLPRIRAILDKPELFVVVQDAFLTETASRADVVLPTALWAERTGTFTNVNRTVHLSLKAVEPPGAARSDLDIFLDYAKRMELRDKDGGPLVKWHDAEGAFEAWKRCTAGRPCDYTGLSYAKLTGSSGICWPCNADHPDGKTRLYEDFHFPTELERCETFGHDLVTGADVKLEEYKGIDPRGRAFLKPCEYQPPHESPDAEYPLWLSTGRVMHHFHTRTKTGRAPALQAAAPEALVQISREDGAKYGIADGDLVRITSRRGEVEAVARLDDTPSGRVFLPFHYGYWDDPERMRAANELTRFEWDPVSKQPYYKYAAVKLQKVRKSKTDQPDRSGPGAPSVLVKAAKKVAELVNPPREHVREYLGLLDGSERALAEALEKVAEFHTDEPDIHEACTLLASWSRKELAELQPIIARYGEARETEPKRLGRAISPPLKKGGLGLVRDLHDCWLLACETHMSLVVLDQASKGLRDDEMRGLVERVDDQNRRQRAWLETRIKQAAPQALVVPS